MEAADINNLWWLRGRLPEDNVAWDKLTPEGRVRASAPCWTHNMMVGIYEVGVRNLALYSFEPLVRELAGRVVESIDYERSSD